MIVARQFIAWYPRENGNRPVGHGMIGSVKRATISTTNQPGIRIRPCPRDGFSIESVPAPKDFRGWLRSFSPSGTESYKSRRDKWPRALPGLTLTNQTTNATYPDPHPSLTPVSG